MCSTCAKCSPLLSDSYTPCKLIWGVASSRKPSLNPLCAYFYPLPHPADARPGVHEAYPFPLGKTILEHPHEDRSKLCHSGPLLMTHSLPWPPGRQPFSADPRLEEELDASGHGLGLRGRQGQSCWPPWSQLCPPHLPKTSARHQGRLPRLACSHPTALGPSSSASYLILSSPLVSILT